MTDRELLEAAAKAAGIKVAWRDAVGCLCYSGSPYHVAWNPLTDDGDALRLAVQLGLWVASDNELGQSFVADDPEGGGRVALIEWHSAGGSLEATRRAIVRAAAEMAAVAAA